MRLKFASNPGQRLRIVNILRRWHALDSSRTSARFEGGWNGINARPNGGSGSWKEAMGGIAVCLGFIAIFVTVGIKYCKPEPEHRSEHEQPAIVSEQPASEVREMGVHTRKQRKRSPDQRYLDAMKRSCEEHGSESACRNYQRMLGEAQE